MLAGNAEVFHQCACVEVDLQPLDQRLRLPIQAAPVDQSGASRDTAKKDVFGHRQVRREIQLLVNHGNAERHRLTRVLDVS